MSKRDQQRFVREATALIEKYGGVANDDHYDWTMETKYGRLVLRIDDHRTGDGPGTVFTRFDEPKWAYENTNCNPYSGKWNHHYFNNWTLKTALTDLEYQLKTIAINETVYVMLRDGGPDDLFALFPEVAANFLGTLCSCLCEIGGHTGADYHKCVRASKPAKGERAEQMLTALRANGYDNLKIITRCTQRMHETRMKEALA